ncbi:MAG TPA: hypothetical protein VHW92_06370 [Mycobacteriales bacterium]|jgi:hypothetical protein|nr:hypothetical protein [Mycobacteriales bacterium]
MSQPPAVPPSSPQPDDVDALAAALRADSADLDLYARVFTTSLAEALPQGMVTVERDRSMGDRVAGRPGTVRLLRVDTGETTLELGRGRGGVPVARIARAVRGVVISSKEVPIDTWVQALADHLAVRARESAAARDALARLLGAG